jgi:hypothetical protein
MDYAAILKQASDAAAAAVADLPDRGACGFAWVEIKGNTGFGKYAKAHGASRHWKSGLYFWNPGRYCGQSIDAIEAGAIAFAKVLQSHGIDAYACSRLD